MTQEEKAKLYDELKVKAQELAEDGYIDKLALVDMFPELKESEDEDEKIRKGLIALIKECLVPPTLFRFGLNKEDTIGWLEKQGEQKPVNKVEQKFEVGDWVTIK